MKKALKLKILKFNNKHIQQRWIKKIQVIKKRYTEPDVELNMDTSKGVRKRVHIIGISGRGHYISMIFNSNRINISTYTGIQ